MKCKDIPVVDMHMHSTVSDGSDSPEEICSRVEEAGIGIFSLTDHDAINGCKQVRQILKEDSPFFINGIEFSCQDKLGKYHILGYDYNEDGRTINDAVEKGHNLRMSKLNIRLDYLRDEFGFAFSDEDIKKLASNPNPGKPHIGNLMVEYGYANSKDEAIEKYINKKRTPGAYLTPEEAITAILESDGIPILAHPTFGNGGQLIMGDEMEERLVRLMDMGLAGIEAWYSGFSGKITRQLLGFADKYKLYVTAGSDYHGSNKLVELADTNLTPDTDVPEGMVMFLDRIYKNHEKTLQKL
jgi:predicted metal-dependent phosphoesterase TrpH